VDADRQEEGDHERVLGGNLAGLKEKDWEAAEKLRMELEKERANLDTECTEYEVEQEASWCQDPMSSVLNATANKIRNFAKSKRGWNADIKKR